MYTNFEDLTPLSVPSVQRCSYLQLRVRMGATTQSIADVIGCSAEEYEILETSSLSELSTFELHAISSMVNSLSQHLPIINTDYFLTQEGNTLVVTQECSKERQDVHISNAASCDDSVVNVISAFWVLYIAASGEMPKAHYIDKFYDSKDSDVSVWSVNSQIVKADRTVQMPCEVWLEACSSGQVLASFLPSSLSYDDVGFSERYFALCLLKFGGELVKACDGFLASGAKYLGRSHIDILLRVFREHRRICRLGAPW